ncbi:MAG: sulfatase [Candidatus Omnitrophota bacterium]
MMMEAALHHRREFMKRTGKTLMGAAALTKLTGAAAASAQEKLNFVVILIDDMGWTDLHCFGSDFYETPNIDRLAAQGMKFTNAYSACTVCSPTRASLLTGKYPATLRLTDWIAGHKRPWAKLSVPEFNQELPLQEKTIAEMLKPLGYVCGSIGKWHLGTEPFFPDKQGFDVNIAGTELGQPRAGYFSPYKIPTLADGPEGEYLTDRMGVEAVKFIQENKNRPFFLYLPHFAVHTPLQAKKELIEKYKTKIQPDADQKNSVYAAMIQCTDEAVGKVMTALEKAKIADKTVVIFTSDNGGLIGSTSNKPLRAGKGSAYEGGVRVPAIVRWPGVVEQGSVCEEPIISADIYPAIREISGARDENSSVEGVSFLPLLRRTRGLKREALYWHYPHYHPGGAAPYSAIRKGDWRLIEFFEERRLELYNLKEDIGETKNLAEIMPEKTQELYAMLAEWRRKCNAQFPAINPDYDPAREKDGPGGRRK